MLKKTLCIVFVFLVLPQQTQWDIVKEENGITVYNRTVTGSAFNEFKAVAIINARIETVGEVLRDVASYPSWAADIVKAKVIQKISDDNMLVYFHQNVQWPVEDRDMLLKINTLTDFSKGRSEIRIIGVNSPLIQSPNGTTRVKEISGQYLLEYIEREHTRVTYSVKSDPGGSIPASLANMSSKDIPYRTLLGLKKMVLLPKYIKLGELSNDKKDIEAMIEKGILKQ